MWSRIIITLAIGALIFTSCKTKRKIAMPSPDTPTEISAASAASIKTFEMNNLDFHTFSGRAKAKIEMGKNAHDVTLNVRIERNKAIWLSVTAILGVEVARILITPDSVKILNKFQGEYIAKPFSYIYNYTNRGVTFATLQDLLMANVSSNLLRTENVQVASATDEFIVVGIKEQLSYQYRINKENRPFNFVLQEVGGTHNLEAFYGDYAKTVGYNFPRNVALNIVGEEVSLKVQLGYNRVAFNENIEMPFSVSSRYKVIN
ncbi:DUF4292 domain-containing protein [Sphingobacterium haloxyli]|uniref:DUF4292 domain-containing protein n=1 Tax=Sphingobacterium haloxyli TaxID=2100533 RepID=A0A2S9J5E2_9SPHI|nr:DUF4292 domain-containing protein [Sphingobacterium haloxyli]PRD47970.1 DUF4292 domain-containing protein [Sphingobacterium haloxyli]